MSGIYRVTQTGVVTEIVGPVALLCHPIDSIQGIPVASTLPTTGQVLKYESGQWAPGVGGGVFPTTYSYSSSVYTNSSANVWILMYSSGRIAYLPVATDGLRITVVDGAGSAGNGTTGRIYVYNSSYAHVGTIMTDYGSLTFVWSSGLARWVIE